MAAFLCLLGGIIALYASGETAPDAHAIPVIDGNIGSCSVEFRVTAGAGAPVYDAKIRVRIAYGFLNTHKLDLEVGTNVDGKARFTGLPDKVKEALHFRASQGDRYGEAFYNPADSCTAKHEIVLKSEDKPGPP